MSASDIERFVADLKGNAEMLGELQKSSTGLSHVVDYAKGKGYDISLDEAQAYIKAEAKTELDDAQLDAVAAGKGHHHSVADPAQTQVVVMAPPAGPPAAAAIVVM
ncbi:MAG: Nif11-like leader peptide family natural product precursor [Rhodospirillaceae bacterium]|nr:Nif11-like leader peptide family natural product precursor [Rhodospirillaceae bacterium]MBT5658836.1 Nif11-like leader peptide family natural product precursor [Rhodospirillaceae bacterium]